MQEKIEVWKWLTGLTPQKRVVAYTALIILVLGFFVYGLVSYIHRTVERDQKECLDNINRLTSERDHIQTKLEVAQDKYLKRLEKEIEERKILQNKTEELKEKVNENN